MNKDLLKIIISEVTEDDPYISLDVAINNVWQPVLSHTLYGTDRADALTKIRQYAHDAISNFRLDPEVQEAKVKTVMESYLEMMQEIIKGAQVTQ